MSDEQDERFTGNEEIAQDGESTIVIIDTAGTYEIGQLPQSEDE